MTFSVSAVMPIHNEEKFLPYSLSALKNAPLNELIFLLDRCTDKSEEIITRFKPSYDVKVFHASKPKWKNHIAEVFNEAFSLSNKDIIFALSGDILYNPKIFDTEPFQTFDMVSFRMIAQDFHTSLFRMTYENVLSSLFEKIDFQEIVWRGGIFGTKKEIWRKLGFTDKTYKHNEHLLFRDYRDRLIKHGFKWCYVPNIANLHLRSTQLKRETQILEGKHRVGKYPLWRVLSHSLIHVKPHVLVSFLNERKRQKNFPRLKKLKEERQKRKEGYLRCFICDEWFFPKDNRDICDECLWIQLRILNP